MSLLCPEDSHVYVKILRTTADKHCKANIDRTAYEDTKKLGSTVVLHEP